MELQKFLFLVAIFVMAVGCSEGIDFSSTTGTPSIGIATTTVTNDATSDGSESSANASTTTDVTLPSENTPTAPPPSGIPPEGGKSLFSWWVTTDGKVAIDWRLGEFNIEKPLILTTATKQSCTCQATTRGQASSGTVDLNSCSGNLSYGSLTCASFNGVAQHTLANNLLKFCHPAISCFTLK